MLARTQINNTSANVYTCPAGKKAYVYVDVASNDGSQVSITVSVGDGTTFYTYWTGTTNFLSVRLVLDAGDIVRVETTGVVNVFVYGIER
jgi:threonine synthase